MSAVEIISLTYPLQESAAPLPERPLSIAIGHFDGVHRGHQNVIRRAVEAAKERGLLSAVMTFDPHPKEVLGQGGQYFSCLTPLEAKSRLFAELGVDVLFVMKFDLRFASISPRQFADEVLRALGVKCAVVGFDFTFGSKGAGTAETLAELGRPDIEVHIVEPLYENGVKVSSTYTRESLESGDLAMANTLLGRPYEVEGTVVRGDGRGRTIGFPTANLELSQPYVEPRLGVYAVTVWIDGRPQGGVMNYGMKPTFNKDEIRPVMEVHLFDFDRDIYGKPMRIQFREFIRPEQKFSGVGELIAQIGADAERAKRLWLDDRG